jgi:hypothetical protein
MVVLGVVSAVLVVQSARGSHFAPATPITGDENGPVNELVWVSIDDPALSKSLTDALRAHGAANERVLECFDASLRGEYAGLELVAKRFGGGFRSTEAEYEPMRRALRAWPIANRPPFAREWTQPEWERWIDGASRTELLSLPQDVTHSPVRSIDLRTIEARVVPEFTGQSLRELEASLRELAKREGISVAGDARMIQATGRFIYTDPTDNSPRNPEMLVVTLRGRSLDDRDFVAAYLFAKRGQSDWFPFRIAALSSSANDAPENRAPPFVPAF